MQDLSLETSITFTFAVSHVRIKSLYALLSGLPTEAAFAQALPHKKKKCTSMEACVMPRIMLLANHMSDFGLTPKCHSEIGICATELCDIWLLPAPITYNIQNMTPGHSRAMLAVILIWLGYKWIHREKVGWSTVALLLSIHLLSISLFHFLAKIVLLKWWL